MPGSIGTTALILYRMPYRPLNPCDGGDPCSIPRPAYDCSVRKYLAQEWHPLRSALGGKKNNAGSVREVGPAALHQAHARPRLATDSIDSVGHFRPPVSPRLQVFERLRIDGAEMIFCAYTSSVRAPALPHLHRDSAHTWDVLDLATDHVHLAADLSPPVDACVHACSCRACAYAARTLATFPCRIYAAACGLPCALHCQVARP